MLTFIIAWLIGCTLYLLWDFVDIMQLTSQLPMMRVLLPYHVQKVYEKITEIATFQIIKTDLVDFWLYGLTEAGKVPFNTNLALAGHESVLFIVRIGSPWY